MTTLQEKIESAFEQRDVITPERHDPAIKEAVMQVINHLDNGTLRVSEKIDDNWVTHQWIKKAVLLAFRLWSNEVVDAGFCRFYDKIPLKYVNTEHSEFNDQGARIVPHAIVRKGAFISKGVILMPSYVNLGAYIGENTMIDTWATVGSCAQIGNNVHISGGAGIGGVLEPLQANPTIIEDNCFIGARSEVVEGVIIEEHSVLSMGVFIGQSTKIYNRQTGEISYGRIPKGSVVIPGSLPSKQGDCHQYCVVIIKQVDAATRAKVAINELLRD